MSIVSLDAAKLQLGLTGDEDNLLVTGLISAAHGIVEQALERDIYLTRPEVPENDTNAIVVDELKKSKQSALAMAIKLVLSTLYLHRESTTELNLSENPAFKACLAGFTEVYVG